MPSPPAITRPGQSIVGHSGRAIFEPLCRLFLSNFCRLSIYGEPPRTGGPYLVCANHRSHIDSIAIMVALAPLSFSQCGLLAAQDYFFRGPLRVKLLAEILPLIAFDRRPMRHSFERTVSACERFLRDGGRVLIAYPEGTRRADADMGSFKRGPALLAIRLGLPILPVHVGGTGAVLPRGSRLPRPGPISVAFGELIDVVRAGCRAELGRLSREVARSVEDRVRALNPQTGES